MLDPLVILTISFKRCFLSPGFILSGLYPQAKTFFLDDVNSTLFFPKQFFAGAFIAIVMTGLDQDMMQKNLSCRDIKDAQKNMFWFSIVLVFVNLLFLGLGALLYLFANQLIRAMPVH